MHHIVLQSPTPDLEKSKSFYTKLNFQVATHNDSVYCSDGKVLIEINPDRRARAGVKLYAGSWSGRIEHLEEMTAVNSFDNGHLVSDPSGVWIYLMEGEGPDLPGFHKTTPSLLGNFVGLSLETTDIKRSEQMWNILGFSKDMGNAEQGWLTMKSDAGLTVSLMSPFKCPHLFFNPSMTFFNGKKNLDIIRKLRELNIEFTEEVTVFNDEGVVDNVIIRDPGGYGFFVFND